MPLFGHADVEKLRLKRDIPGLIRALRDDKVCSDAARALRDSGDERAEKPLIALLQNRPQLADDEVVSALGEVGGVDAVDPLMGVLGNRDMDAAARRCAAIALGKIGDARAVELLIAALEDEFSNVRQSAAWALGLIRDARAVEPLIAALSDPAQFVRVSEDAAWALGKIGDARAVEPLIDLLKCSEGSIALRAADALGQFGDARAVEPLIATLEGANEKGREAAAEALGEFADVRAVTPLIAALRDSDDAVRQSAHEALQKICDARAVEPLCAALRNPDPYVGPDNPTVYQIALELLMKIDDPDAVEPFCRALQDSDAHVRNGAAQALCNFSDPRIVEPLASALEDLDSRLRGLIAETLGRIGDARATEPLVALLLDPAVDVRKTTATVLDRIGWVPSSDESGAAYLAIRGEWDRCVEIGTAAIRPLVIALETGGTDAALALGRLREPALDALIAALDRSKRSDFQLEAAAKALGEIGGPRALEALMTVLTDDEYPAIAHRGAEVGLGKIGEAAVKPLVALLKDGNWSHRQRALGALHQSDSDRAAEVLRIYDYQAHQKRRESERDYHDWARKEANKQGKKATTQVQRAKETEARRNTIQASGRTLVSKDLTGSGWRGNEGEFYCSEACLHRGLDQVVAKMAEIRSDIVFCESCNKSSASAECIVVPSQGGTKVLCGKCGASYRKKAKWDSICSVCGR